MLIEGVVYNEINSKKNVEQFSSQVFIYLCEKSQHSSGNIGTLFHCICKTSKAIQSEHMPFHNSLLHACSQKLVLRMCLASGYVMYVRMYVFSTVRSKVLKRFWLTTHIRILHLIASIINYIIHSSILTYKCSNNFSPKLITLN